MSRTESHIHYISLEQFDAIEYPPGTPKLVWEGDEFDLHGSTDGILARLNIFIAGGNFSDLQRGDVVRLDWEHYRNDGVYIFDGVKVIDLEYDYDDYGHVPSQFKTPEFPPLYFEDVIGHDRLFWLDTKHYEQQLRMNFRCGSSFYGMTFQEEEIPDGENRNIYPATTQYKDVDKVCWTSFTHNNINYKILFDGSNGDDDDDIDGLINSCGILTWCFDGEGLDELSHLILIGNQDPNVINVCVYDPDRC